MAAAIWRAGGSASGQWTARIRSSEDAIEVRAWRVASLISSVRSPPYHRARKPGRARKPAASAPSAAPAGSSSGACSSASATPATRSSKSLQYCTASASTIVCLSGKNRYTVPTDTPAVWAMRVVVNAGAPSRSSSSSAA